MSLDDINDPCCHDRTDRELGLDPICARADDCIAWSKHDTVAEPVDLDTGLCAPCMVDAWRTGGPEIGNAVFDALLARPDVEDIVEHAIEHANKNWRGRQLKGPQRVEVMPVEVTVFRAVRK